jgi:hypothetical protein
LPTSAPNPFQNGLEQLSRNRHLRHLDNNPPGTVSRLLSHCTGTETLPESVSQSGDIRAVIAAGRVITARDFALAVQAQTNNLGIGASGNLFGGNLGLKTQYSLNSEYIAFNTTGRADCPFSESSAAL